MRLLSLGLAVCALALSLLVPMTAFADTIALPVSNSIDVSPILGELASGAVLALAPILASFAIAALLRFRALIGVQTTAAKDAALRETIEQGLGWAAEFARARIGASGPIPVDLKSPAIAVAAGYAMRSIPDALGKLGIVEETSERLAEMVEARLGISVPTPAG